MNENAGHRSRLRERYVRSGLEGFADHEVVELLLTLCIPRRDVKSPAKQLIKRFGSLRGILDAQLEDLRDFDGIGEVTAVSLLVIKDILTLYQQQSVESGPLLDGVDPLIELFRLRIAELKVEVFEVAYLDKGLRLMRDGIERLASGTPDRLRIFPRQIMQGAVARHASYIAVAHNHPSGRAMPSTQDDHMTAEIKRACEVVGIPLLDHLIITHGDAYSYRDQGKL